MSDIKKNLILSAKLETSSVAQELKKLKKEFASGVDIDQATFQQFKTEFAKIAEEFGKSLRDAIKDLKVSSARSVKDQKETFEKVRESKSTGVNNNHYRKYLEEGNIFGANNQLKEQEREILQRSRAEKSDYKHFKQYMDVGNERAVTEQPRVQQEIKKQHQLEERLRMGSLKRWGKDYLDYIKTGNKQFITGLGFPKILGRKVDSVTGGRGAELMASRVSGMGGIGGMALRGAGVAGLAIGGVAMALNAMAGLALRHAARGRETRTALAEKQFEVAQGVTEGDVFGTAVRQQRRKEGLGTANRVGANIRGFFGDISALRFGDAFTGKGAQARVAQEEREEGDVSLAEIRPLQNAVQSSLLPRMRPRVEALQGGSLTSGDLTQRAREGARLGFSQDEVLEQIQIARPFLGNRELAGSRGQENLGLMQDRQRRYGVDIGLQAASAETFRGFSNQGMSATQGLRFQADILKKGVAAGLDASKTSKFLETTSDYVAGTAGLANLDLSEVTNSIAGLARGFADASGREDVTTGDLARARQTQDILKKESLSSEGISGLGNISGILDAAREAGVKLSPGEFLSLQNTSADASIDSILQTLSENKASPEQKDKLARLIEERKDSAFDYGAKTLGLDRSFRAAMRGREQGITTESAQNLERVSTQRESLISGVVKRQEQVVDPTGALGSSELSNLANQAVVDLTNFTSGFAKLTEINKSYGEQVDRLKESLRDAALRADEFLKDQTQLRNPAPHKSPHNSQSEDAARERRFGRPGASGSY